MSYPSDNIFAGTQVVSLVEIRGPSHSLVHPRGAVGVVTRTPAVPGENYLVRFPDGFEKTLEPTQLEVLKHFKDRLGADQVGRVAPRAPDTDNPTFDLEQVIIYRCVIGSRTYGLDTEVSDMPSTKPNTSAYASSSNPPTTPAPCPNSPVAKPAPP